MPFNYDAPTEGSQLASEPVRSNFQALALHHRSTEAPPGPRTGYIWWDASNAQNELLKARFGDVWVVLFEHMESTPVPANGAASAFTALTDTPSVYTGQAGKAVLVKGDQSGLEFGQAGAETFVGLSDTPAAYTGQGGKVVSVKGDVSGLEFTTPGGGGGDVSIQTGDYTLDQPLDDNQYSVNIGTDWRQIIYFGLYCEKPGGGGFPVLTGATYWTASVTLSGYSDFGGGAYNEPPQNVGKTSYGFSTNQYYAELLSTAPQGATSVQIDGSIHPLSVSQAYLVLHDGTNYEFVYVDTQTGTNPRTFNFLGSIQRPGGWPAGTRVTRILYLSVANNLVLKPSDSGLLYYVRTNTAATEAWRVHLIVQGWKGSS